MGWILGDSGSIGWTKVGQSISYRSPKLIEIESITGWRGRG